MSTAPLLDIVTVAAGDATGRHRPAAIFKAGAVVAVVATLLIIALGFMPENIR